jgi:Family of unknown function (DUF5319)
MALRPLEWVPMEESEFEPEGPLDDEEREALRQDLTDVESLKSLLGPKGIRGVVFYCPDCDEDHFLGWDLLRGNLEQLLEDGDSPVHEPAFDPDPNDYVSWDFARGFLDGYEQYEHEELIEVTSRLSAELTSMGWEPTQVKGFLARIGLQAPSRAES